MNRALRPFIGRFCHVYLDNIIVWSSSLKEHERHVCLILSALREHNLYVSDKKTELFKYKISFLGHHISQRGIEADQSKVDKIVNWPRPTTATEIHSFLGLIRYISHFLPSLAEHTRLLTPLTTKEADKKFPPWNSTHQDTFQRIKDLVLSWDCLTTIDHQNMGNNRVFVTTDTSDWRTGALLSYGETWETARPVAFDSTQLRAAKLNYAVHKKELLAIIKALKKWHSDLLGIPFEIRTDHKTLENFHHQRDLSRRQARWQDFLSQYDFTIKYIKGEDNSVADALSRLPSVPHHTITSILDIQADKELLHKIKDNYKNNPFTKKALDQSLPNLGFSYNDGLIFVNKHLVIPRALNLRETFFRLAHDNLGHFGFDKSYMSLRSVFYWPNMRQDLETAYVPSCEECQCNKPTTKCPPGPLHPLPIPDQRGDSVAIDFVGPLPEDQGFNALTVLTDTIGVDICLIPTCTNVSAKQFAQLFFVIGTATMVSPFISSLIEINCLPVDFGKPYIPSQELN